MGGRGDWGLVRFRFSVDWGAAGAVWAGGGWCGTFLLLGGGSCVRLRFLW